MKTLAIAGAVLCLPLNAAAQVTERVSVDSSGGQAGFGGDLPVPPGLVLSPDGRYAAFSSPSVLDSGDTNGTWDVFIRDRLAGLTERVSVSTGGAQANGPSGLYAIAISADGRFVAFDSTANNLAPGDTNGVRDIFLRDRLGGTTELVSIATGGVQGNGTSFHIAITPDARFVAFESVASNLVA